MFMLHMTITDLFCMFRMIYDLRCDIGTGTWVRSFNLMFVKWYRRFIGDLLLAPLVRLAGPEPEHATHTDEFTRSPLLLLLPHHCAHHHQYHTRHSLVQWLSHEDVDEICGQLVLPQCLSTFIDDDDAGVSNMNRTIWNKLSMCRWRCERFLMNHLESTT